MWKKHTDVSSVLALLKIVAASQHKRQRKKIFVKICWQLKTPTRTWKLVHALYYANELLLRVRLAFQNFANSPNKQKLSKQVLVMIKHCLGKSQINSTPTWSKEFSYIAFLYRTLAKVYMLARADIIHSQREIKEISDLKTHPFIN